MGLHQLRRWGEVATTRTTDWCGWLEAFSAESRHLGHCFGDVSLVVSYCVDADTGSRSFTQVFQDGRLTEAGAEGRDPDLTVLLDEQHAYGILRGEHTGDAAAANVRFGTPGGGFFALPPLDEDESGAFASLPVTPGASFTVRYDYLRAPFGNFRVTQRYDDGRRTATWVGEGPEPEVVGGVDFEGMMAFRAGAATPMDTLTGGYLKGDWSVIAMIAGVLESDAYTAACRALAGPTEALVGYTRLVRSAAYADLRASIG